MADVQREIDQQEWDALASDDDIYGRTPERLQETWYRWRMSSVFDPYGNPRVETGDNVRNVVGLWFAPEETKLLVTRLTFDAGIQDLPTGSRNQFVTRDAMSAVIQDVPGITDTYDDAFLLGGSGNKPLYIFTRRPEIPASRDEVYSISGVEDTVGSAPADHKTLNLTLQRLNTIISANNNLFVLVNMRGQTSSDALAPQGISSMRIITGEDNFWLSGMSLYSRDSSGNESLLPYRMSSMLPFAVNVAQVRDARVKLSPLGRRKPYMIPGSSLYAKGVKLGVPTVLPAVIGNENIRQLLIAVLFITKCATDGFPGLRQFANQSDKDNGINSWMYNLREQVGGKSAADVAAFTANLVYSVRKHVEQGYTYKATFGPSPDPTSPNWRGTFSTDISPTPSETDWEEFEGLLCMMSQDNFSRYSFEYGVYSRMNQALLPLYMSANLLPTSVSDGVTASNSGSNYSVNPAISLTLRSRFVDTVSASLPAYTLYETGHKSEFSYYDIGTLTYYFRGFRYFGYTINSNLSNPYAADEVLTKYADADNDAIRHYESGETYTKFSIADYFSLRDAGNQPKFVFSTDVDGYLLFPSGYVSQSKTRLKDGVRFEPDFTEVLDQLYAAHLRGDTLVDQNSFFRIDVDNPYSTQEYRGDGGGQIYGKIGTRQGAYLFYDVEFKPASPDSVPYVLSTGTQLNDQVSYARAGDQIISLDPFPDTLSEQQIPALASGLTAENLPSWVWVYQPSGITLSKWPSVFDGEFITGNTSDLINNNTTLPVSFPLSPQPAISSLEFINAYATRISISLTFVNGNDANGNPLLETDITIGRNYFQSSDPQCLFLGSYTDETVATTRIVF